MNLSHRSQIEAIFDAFEQGRLNRHQAIESLMDMPEHPDFKGIWEILIVHVALLAGLDLASKEMEWFLQYSTDDKQ